MTDGQRTKLYISAIQVLGLYHPQDLQLNAGSTLAALSEYLDAAYDGRASNFSVGELCKLKYPRHFGSGATYLVPPVAWWPRVLLLRWWADLLRADDPAWIAHLYRPEPYNSRIGSRSINHVFCCAVDIDFTKDAQFDEAIRKCESLYRSPINFQIGYGVGAQSRRLHVDFWTPKVDKPRWWAYGPGYGGPGRSIA